MTHKLATGCMHMPSTPMHQQTIDKWNATTAMQCGCLDTIQYNPIQYNTMQSNAIQCNAIQYNPIQYNAIQCNTMQCNWLLATSRLDRECVVDRQRESHGLDGMMGISQSVVGFP
jgi:hypothetical protein